MKMLQLLSVGAALALSLQACSDEGLEETDAALRRDSGSHRDAGFPEDAGLPRDAGLPADAGTSPTVTTVRLLHYNDLHANLVPHLDKLRHTDGSGAPEVVIGERGGIARLKTLVDRLRAEVPHSILTNVGDTYHGGAEAMFTNGNAIAAPMNALGVDIGTMGNWDFAYGPGVTMARYDDDPCAGPACPSYEVLRPNWPNIVANVFDTRPRPIGGDPSGNTTWLPPTMVIERGGVRVGFIGLTSDIVPRMHTVLAAGMTFLGANDGLTVAQAELAYRDLVDQHAADLRGAQRADVVVVLSELGIQKDKRLADILVAGAVDVFLSAHTHEVTYAPITTASGALVVEAGNDGYLGAMDIDVEDGVVVDARWTLHEVTPDIPEDAAMAALVATARAPFLGENVSVTGYAMTPGAEPPTLDMGLDTVVGHVQTPLDRRNALENTFNDAFTDMLRAEAGTALAISPGFRFDAILLPDGAPLENEGMASGDVTLEQVYRFFPVSYTLGTGQITGANLRALIEDAADLVFSADVWSQNGGWLEGFSGLDVHVDLAAGHGQRVSGLRVAGGAAIADADVLTVGGCRRPFDADDVICSHSGFTNVTDLVRGGAVMTPQQLLVERLSDTITPRRGFTDTNATPLWPDVPFVQPLEGVE